MASLDTLRVAAVGEDPKGSLSGSHRTESLGTIQREDRELKTEPPMALEGSGWGRDPAEADGTA
jgi:hypothetical protein